MADYIYLLENRLSGAQRKALRLVREIAKAKGLTVFLVGGAVRDLTSGSPVRDLDVVVQGNALKLRKDIEKSGAQITGELEAGQALFLSFPGGVRLELGSTLSVTFPKPGKPVVKPATILDDLRRRDFTANAMAISLNEGSYGLLMDPLNGVADIENRELRLVSNYGFIEDPVRMIRAARLMARLGWTLDERTQARYQTGVQEGYISVLSDFHRGYETEEIVHEEDPLRVLKRLEAEGWMKHLAPFWTSAKVNVAELERLRDVQTQLQMQGIHPDPAAANFPLLTAKLSVKEIATLKKGFPRQGFVAEIEALEAQAKEFAAQLGGKAAASASQSWKLITTGKPEAVLWTAYTSKSPAIQAKLKSFYTEWPQARTRIPYVTMQEMRITPDLPGYEDLLETLFFELMDGRLQTPEEIKAFLEPYSPPAPPPPVSMRRPRAAKKEAKAAKSRSKKAAKETDEDSESDVDLDAESSDQGEAHDPVPTKIEPEEDTPAKQPVPPVNAVSSDSPAVGHGEKAKREKVVPPAPAKAVTASKAPTKTPAKESAKPAIKPTAPVKATVPVKAVPVKASALKSSHAKKAATKKSAPTVKAAARPAPQRTAKSSAGTPASSKKTAPAKTARKAPVKAAPAKKAAAPAKKVAPAKRSVTSPAKKTAAGTSKGKSAPAKIVKRR